MRQTMLFTRNATEHLPKYSEVRHPTCTVPVIHLFMLFDDLYC